MICFGIVSISWNCYTRRCERCGYTKVYNLPKLKKKIIYLDQFVISNITNTLNKVSKSHKRVNKDQYWLDLYKLLDRLLKLQIIVCPSTDYCRQESARSQDYKSIFRIIKHLSNDTFFNDNTDILRFQIYQHFKGYLTKNRYTPAVLDPQFVIQGIVHGWTEVFVSMIDLSNYESLSNELKSMRDERYEHLKKAIPTWLHTKEISFVNWAKNLANQYALSIANNYLCNFSKLEIANREDKFQYIHDIAHMPSTLVFYSLRKACEDYSITGSRMYERIFEFLLSDAFFEIPVVKIEAMLWASLRRKILGGQNKLPSRGLYNDIKTMSSIINYCDVVFTDNEIAGYLRENPLRQELDNDIRIFSNNSRNEFLSYLLEIEKNIGKSHIDLVKEVYGNETLQPYMTILD